MAQAVPLPKAKAGAAAPAFVLRRKRAVLAEVSSA